MKGCISNRHTEVLQNLACRVKDVTHCQLLLVVIVIWRSTERSVEAVKAPAAHHLSFSYHPGNDDALYFDI
jgi:hypothetical protein